MAISQDFLRFYMCLLLLDCVSNIHPWSRKHIRRLLYIQNHLNLLMLQFLFIILFQKSTCAVDALLMFHRHSSVQTQSDQVLVFGGGGNCFSFGTHLNTTPVLLDLKHCLDFMDSTLSQCHISTPCPSCLTCQGFYGVSETTSRQSTEMLCCDPGTFSRFVQWKIVLLRMCFLPCR